MSENWDSGGTGFLPAGWVNGVHVVVENAVSYSGANAVWNNVNITTETALYTGATDGNGGFCRASHVTFATLTNISANSYVLCRVTTAASLLTNCVGYYLNLDFVGNGISIGYIATGSLHTLVSNTGPVLGTTDKYRAFIEAVGSAITGRIQRISDSKWLKSDNTWQIAQQDYLTATDTHVTGAGNAGFASNRFNTSDQTYSDDFLWETVGSPSRMTQVISF